MVPVVEVSCPNTGCDMISARRSMSSIETSATARCSNCSVCCHGQWNGVSFGIGWNGVMRL